MEKGGIYDSRDGGESGVKAEDWQNLAEVNLSAV